MRVGIIGGGQLGRMMALAGYPLGVATQVLEPAADCPAGQVTGVLPRDYHDPDALAQLARESDVITYEFENVPVEPLRAVASSVAVYPPVEALAIAQDRLLEKKLFVELGMAVPRFAPVDSLTDLRAAIGEIGLPAVLKTRRLGYDGKGQAVIRDADGLEQAWRQVGARPCLLEQWVPFEHEAAIVAARARDGSIACYPLVETRHEDGILVQATAPSSNVTDDLQRDAETLAGRLLERLDYGGVIALELFVTSAGLLANEFAPRVHNSGHWTIEGATTSQFENHLRAVLGLPLGVPSAIGHSVMLNLIGSHPPIEQLAALPGSAIHLYGKIPRPGRKIGHITIRAADPETLATRLNAAQAILRSS